MVERRLATVLVADVAGYSRLMAEDDEATLAQLARHRGVIEQLLAQHRGRAFGEVADSVLAEFSSPVEAVRCAVDLQHALHLIEAERPEPRRMRWRIGLNLGDVMAHGRDLVGDGVNVAARLESLARPGGICLSASVIEHVRSHLALDFESLGRLQLKNITRPVDAFRIPLPSDVELTAPYRGLLPFDEDAAAMFCGRSKAVADARDRLQLRASAGRAFLLIWGASGVGKSSLVRAGLVPTLCRAPASDAAGRWLVVAWQPVAGDDPLQGFAAAAGAALRSQDGSGDHPGMRAALGRLARRGPESAGAFQAALRAAGARLLVIVDQLEVLIADPAIDSGTKATFVAALRALAETGQVWVIATLRGDFYHRCAEIAGLAELRDGHGSYELLAPSPSEIGQMIREPVRRAGLEFEHTEQDGRLDDLLLEDAVASRVPLPLLSVTMAGLCSAASHRMLTFAEYRAMGGFRGAIAKRAEDAVGRLPAATAEALPGLLRALVTIAADGSITARTVDRNEIATSPERTGLVENLIAARLLVSDHSEGANGTVRLAHEALLTHWPRAADQLRADRALLAARTDLERDRLRWTKEGRPSELLLPPGRRLAEAEELLGRSRAELGAELGGYLEASIRARDLAADRSLRRARTLAATLALLAVGASLLAYEANRARHAAELARLEMIALQQQADAARVLAELERDKAEAASSRLLARRAQDAIDLGQPGLALALALKALPKAQADPDAGPDTAQARQALLEALDAQRRVGVLSPGGKGVTSAVFSPDGSAVATGTGDGRARIWRLDDDSVALATTQGGDAVLGLAYSPDGARIAGAMSDGTITIWDAQTGVELASAMGHSDRVTSIAWHPSGDHLLSTSWDGAARLWDGVDLAPLRTMQTSDGFMWSGAFDPAGAMIVTAGESGVLRFWDPADGTLLREHKAHDRRIWSVAYAPDGSRIATGAHDRLARIWDSRTLRLEHELGGHADWVITVAFSGNGRRLATGSADQSVGLWDVATGAPLGQLKGHRHRVWSVRFNPDDTELISASEDGTAQLWDMREWLPDIVAAEPGEPRAVAFAPDGTIVIGDSTGAVRIRDAATGGLVRNLVAGGPPVLAVATDDRRRVMVASAEGPVQLWRLSDGELERTIDAGGGRISAAALARDGELVAIGSADGGIRLFDLANGGSHRLLAAHRGPVTGLMISQDCKLLVSVGADGTARLWDVPSRTQRRVLVEQPLPLLSAAIAADNGRAVIAGTEALLIVDLADDGAVRRLDIGGETIEAVAFAGISHSFATAGRSGTVQLWDADNGGGIDMFRVPGAGALGVALSADGQRIVTGASDGTVRLWAVPKWNGFADVLEHARTILPDGLTPDERDDDLLGH